MGHIEGRLLLATLKWYSFDSIMILTQVLEHLMWRSSIDPATAPSECSHNHICFWRGFIRLIPYMSSLSLPTEWNSIKQILQRKNVRFPPDPLDKVFGFNNPVSNGMLPTVEETHNKMLQTKLSLLQLLNAEAGVLWEYRWILELQEISYMSQAANCTGKARHSSLSEYLNDRHMSLELHYNFTWLPCSVTTAWPPEGKGEKDNPQMHFLLQKLVPSALQLLPRTEHIYFGLKLSQLLRLSPESRSLIRTAPSSYGRGKLKIGVLIDGTFNKSILPDYLSQHLNQVSHS